MKSEYEANEALARAVASRRTYPAPIPRGSRPAAAEGLAGVLLAVLIGLALACVLFFKL